jgi:hypothetical protein
MICEEPSIHTYQAIIFPFAITMLFLEISHCSPVNPTEWPVFASLLTDSKFSVRSGTYSTFSRHTLTASSFPLRQCSSPLPIPRTFALSPLATVTVSHLPFLQGFEKTLIVAHVACSTRIDVPNVHLIFSFMHAETNGT